MKPHDSEKETMVKTHDHQKHPCWKHPWSKKRSRREAKYVEKTCIIFKKNSKEGIIYEDSPKERQTRWDESIQRKGLVLTETMSRRREGPFSNSCWRAQWRRDWGGLYTHRCWEGSIGCRRRRNLRRNPCFESDPPADRIYRRNRFKPRSRDF